MGALAIILLIIFGYMLVGLNPNDEGSLNEGGNQNAGENPPGQAGGELPSDNAAVNASFNQSINMPLGTLITFPDTLNVYLREIMDSRCPAGVQCVWEGELAGKFVVYGDGFASAKEIQLGTSRNKTVTLQGYTFTLASATTNSATLRVVKNSSITSPAPSGSPCYVGGCSNQLCTDNPNMGSTCQWTEAYACYKTAKCERQASGQCGWTMTSALQQCLANAR